MKTDQPLFETSLRSLPLLARGKVRDNYAVGNDRILMVATDRLSAFDVVMNQPIPGKGALLTRMALFWFDRLAHVIPNHLTGDNPDSVVAPSEVDQVHGRSMLVHRLRPVPVEAVVRGYLAGSGWSEYQRCGTVCGQALPSGLQLSAKLNQPIFTPATKAAAGDHDENITLGQMAGLVGTALTERIKDVSIRLYQEAAEYALARGIIIADTKFEFGLNENDELLLMDEVLTPDSSRFWPADTYRIGVNPPSFDKQFIRDWLEMVDVDGKSWNKKAPAPELSIDVIKRTTQKYEYAMKAISK